MRGHSMKMMWGCAAVLGLVAVLAIAGVGGGVLVFVIPCMLMMGAMMWLMMGGRGGGSRANGPS